MTKKSLIKHWDKIEAWKNGSELEFKSKVTGLWEKTLEPSFYEELEYRVAKTKEEKILEILQLEGIHFIQTNLRKTLAQKILSVIEEK